MIASLRPTEIAANCPRELVAATCAAARIREEDRVSALEEHQRGESPAETHGAPVPHRPAVDHRDNRLRPVATRPKQQSLDLKAIGRFPAQAPDAIDDLGDLGIPEVERLHGSIRSITNDADLRAAVEALRD